MWIIKVFLYISISLYMYIYIERVSDGIINKQADDIMATDEFEFEFEICH